MKTEIVVNQPINIAFELYLDKNKFKEWKKDFIRYEQISGTTGNTGSVSKLFYKKFTLIETITSKKTPSELIANYEHQQGNNTMMFHTAKNQFTSLGDNRTLIEIESEVTKVNGFILGLIMKLMAGAGRKHAQEQLNQFKIFAEKNQPIL